MKKRKSTLKAKATKSLGDIINELSGKPIPVELIAGGQTFEVFIHPFSENDLTEIQDEIKKAGRLTDDILKSAAAKSFRDDKGVPMWDGADKIAVDAVVWARMRVPILLHCFGIDPARL